MSIWGAVAAVAIGIVGGVLIVAVAFFYACWFEMARWTDEETDDRTR